LPGLFRGFDSQTAFPGGDGKGIVARSAIRLLAGEFLADFVFLAAMRAFDFHIRLFSGVVICLKKAQTPSPETKTFPVDGDTLYVLKFAATTRGAWRVARGAWRVA